MAINYGEYTEAVQDVKPAAIDYGDTIETKQPEKTSASSAAMQGFFQELTFGFSDEIAAGVESIWSDRDYSELVTEQRKDLEKAKKDEQEAYLGGQAVGFGASFLLPGGVFVKGGSKALGYSKGLLTAAKSQGDDAVQAVGQRLIQQAAKEGNESAVKSITNAMTQVTGKAIAGGSNILQKGIKIGADANAGKVIKHPGALSAVNTVPLGALHGAGHAEEGERLKGAGVGAAVGLVPPVVKGAGNLLGGVGLGYGLSTVEPVRRGFNELVGNKVE